MPIQLIQPIFSNILLVFFGIVYPKHKNVKTVLSTITFSFTNSTLCASQRHLHFLCTGSYFTWWMYTDFLHNIRSKWKIIGKNCKNFLWNSKAQGKYCILFFWLPIAKVAFTQWFDLWIFLSFILMKFQCKEIRTKCNRKICNIIGNLCSKNAQKNMVHFNIIAASIANYWYNFLFVFELEIDTIYWLTYW